MADLSIPGKQHTLNSVSLKVYSAFWIIIYDSPGYGALERGRHGARPIPGGRPGLLERNRQPADAGADLRDVRGGAAGGDLFNFAACGAGCFCGILWSSKLRQSCSRAAPGQGFIQGMGRCGGAVGGRGPSFCSNPLPGIFPWKTGSSPGRCPGGSGKRRRLIVHFVAAVMQFWR